ncbi:unnamed protein product [Ceratitis capitata]|uniref:(Mediterranean fruit fly) hypothetical protein n=1 Tax=Ceratitis capitata TaxID=7213 RepID=A0A811UY84_CERCA|nr:unnamed protein product [Ceratitis capitata]
MGLQKHYLRYGRSARDHILGLAGGGRRNTIVKTHTSDNVHHNNGYNSHSSGSHGTHRRSHGGAGGGGVGGEHGGGMPNLTNRPTPLSMLISQGVKINNLKLRVLNLRHCGGGGGGNDAWLAIGSRSLRNPTF